MKAPLGLMPAAVRCQPYPFAGITQVRFLRSPRPVGASQPGLPPALEGGERPELPLSYSVQGKGSTGGRGRQSSQPPTCAARCPERLPNLNSAFANKRLTGYGAEDTLECGKRLLPPNRG